MIRYLKWVAHFLVYQLVSMLQSLVWKLNGIQQHIDRSRSGECFHTSAQQLSIQWRYSPDSTSMGYRSYYIAIHENFIHPERVLQSDCSLYLVTETDAVFVKVPSEIDLEDVIKHPFYMESQYHHATELIVMPICSLIELSQQCKMPKNTIWLYNTNRCGSTAMAQMFHTVPNCSVYAETQAVESHIRDKLLNGEDVHQYIHSTKFRVLCAAATRVTLKNSKNVAFLKVIGRVAISYADVIMELFPDHHFLFLHRNWMTTTQSNYKTQFVKGIEGIKLHLALWRIFGNKLPTVSRSLQKKNTLTAQHKVNSHTNTVN